MQKRRKKMTQSILNFIYFATILSFGFITAKTLKFQIAYLFNESIGLTSLCKQRKLLSNKIAFFAMFNLHIFRFFLN